MFSSSLEILAVGNHHIAKERINVGITFLTLKREKKSSQKCRKRVGAIAHLDFEKI